MNVYDKINELNKVVQAINSLQMAQEYISKCMDNVDTAVELLPETDEYREVREWLSRVFDIELYDTARALENITNRLKGES